MKIYIASPLGFTESTRNFYETKLIRVIKDLGHDVLDPWSLTDSRKIEAAKKLPYGSERRNKWKRLNAEIGDNNRNAIDICDVVLAVLDGVDVDSGTASEIGYAFAKGKPIVGYRGDLRLSSDNEGCVVNLQVEYFIRKSGGVLVFKIADLPTAFKRVVRVVRYS